MDAITTGIWRGRGMTREELAKAIREDYERKGIWACKSNTINMQLDFEMLGIILEALEQEPILDKIRAEITDCLKALDEIEKSGLNIYLPNEISGRRLTYQQCLRFIDKYKAESENS